MEASAARSVVGVTSVPVFTLTPAFFACASRWFTSRMNSSSPYGPLEAGTSCPPSAAPFSYRVTSCPRLAATTAACRPPTPPPTTATFFGLATFAKS